MPQLRISVGMGPIHKHICCSLPRIVSGAYDSGWHGLFELSHITNEIISSLEY